MRASSSDRSTPQPPRVASHENTPDHSLHSSKTQLAGGTAVGTSDKKRASRTSVDRERDEAAVVRPPSRASSITAASAVLQSSSRVPSSATSVSTPKPTVVPLQSDPQVVSSAQPSQLGDSTVTAPLRTTPEKSSSSSPLSLLTKVISLHWFSIKLVVFFYTVIRAAIMITHDNYDYSCCIIAYLHTIVAQG